MSEQRKEGETAIFVCNFAKSMMMKGSGLLKNILFEIGSALYRIRQSIKYKNRSLILGDKRNFLAKIKEVVQRAN